MGRPGRESGLASPSNVERFDNRGNRPAGDSERHGAIDEVNAHFPTDVVADSRRMPPPGTKRDLPVAAYQERLAGNTGILASGAAIIFVFLVLAAQYESWALPLAILRLRSHDRMSSKPPLRMG
jgi:multidrug efflux pump subunit AcrB